MQEVLNIVLVYVCMLLVSCLMCHINYVNKGVGLHSVVLEREFLNLFRVVT